METFKYKLIWGWIVRLELFYSISGFFLKLLMRQWICLSGYLHILMSLKKLRVLLGCLFLIHVPFMLDHFMKKNLWLPMLLPFLFLNMSLLHDLCYTFDHNSNSCPQYIKFKVKIENNIKSAFNSMEHMMARKFSELVQIENSINSAFSWMEQVMV